MNFFFIQLFLVLNINLAIAQTFIVTNTNANGPGSFEEAIIAAEEIKEGSVSIEFTNGLTGTIVSSVANISVPIEILGPGKELLSISNGLFNFTGTAYIEGITLSDGSLTSNAALTLINVNILGGFAPFPQENGGGINASAGDLTMVGCLIKNCEASRSGGGVYYNGIPGASVVSITNTIIEGNTSQSSGAGIYASNCSLRIENSKVEGNKVHLPVSNAGGGIFYKGNDGLLIERSQVINNELVSDFPQGGGIFCDGTLTLNESLIQGNFASLTPEGVAGGSGGGVYILGDGPNDKSSIFNSSIVDNECSDRGGGIYCFGNLELNNSTVSGNITSSISSALYFLNGTIEMKFCTVTNNLIRIMDGNGNAITVFSSDEYPTNLIMENNLVAGNISGIRNDDFVHYSTDIYISPNTNQVVNYNLFNIVGSHLDQNPTNTIATHPDLWGLEQLNNNGGFTPTHALLDHSMAINAADPSVNSGTDQRGFDRVQKGRADIGAYESTFTIDTPTELLSLEPSELVMLYNTTEELVVTLNEPAPSGGVTLNLNSSNPQIASVANMVTIPEGETSAIFLITSYNIPEVTTISVSLDGTTLTSNIAVVSEIPEIPNPCFANEIINFNQGKKKNGGTISDQRSDPGQALKAPQENDTYNFVSLGFGGSITLKLGHNLYDDGSYEPDLILVETSFGRADQMCYTSGERNYPEMAFLEVSEDNNTWYSLPNAYCRTSFIDISPAVEDGLAFVRYLRITDASNNSWFGGNADGFDVDGIITCREDVLEAFDRLTNAHTLAGKPFSMDKFTAFDPAFINKAPNEEHTFTVNIFPNPVGNQPLYLEYSSENESEGTLRILDILGKVAIEKTISIRPGMNRMEINLDTLPKGHYVLQMQTGQAATVVQKLIKN